MCGYCYISNEDMVKNGSGNSDFEFYENCIEVSVFPFAVDEKMEMSTCDGRLLIVRCQKEKYFFGCGFTKEISDARISAYRDRGAPYGAEIGMGRVPYYLIRVMPA